MIILSCVAISVQEDAKRYWHMKILSHHILQIPSCFDTSGGLSRGDVWKSFKVPSQMKGLNLLSILIAFLQKSVEKWDGVGQKMDSAKGEGVTKHTFLVKYFILHWLSKILVLIVCVNLRSKNPFTEVLKKSRLLVLLKMAVFCQI